VPTPNVYTRWWFSTFLGRIDSTKVAPEIAFLERQLEVGSRVLDLCCGPGRHAAPLVSAGYDVVGLDIDAAALCDAAREAPRAAFVRADMRRVPLANRSVDVVICMWQSFGHFDAAGNEAVLAEMARVLRPNGCVVLDVYHRLFYAARQGTRVIERDGDRIHEQRRMYGDRLRVQLHYESSGLEEEFDWLLYTPEDLASAAASAGLRVRLACSEFDEATRVTDDQARMQVVLDAGTA
jgi:SAM-dependent methyltransferase